MRLPAGSSEYLNRGFKIRWYFTELPGNAARALVVYTAERI